MLKSLIIISLRTMSGSKKSKITLAKKLSSKVDMSKAPKVEAELKSELFNDIKNIKNAKSISTNNKKEEVLKTLKRSSEKAAVSAEKHEDDNSAAVLKKKPRSTKTKANNAKEEAVETIDVKDTTTSANFKVEVSKETTKIAMKIESVETTQDTNFAVLKKIPKGTKTKANNVKQEVVDTIRGEDSTASANLKSQVLKQTKKTAIKTETEDAYTNCEPSCSQEIKEETEWQPPNWRQILENIETMRSKHNAPVDSMGCHKCADMNADEKTQRFHKLVALMLSSQTKDDTTYHAMLRLREHTLTPEIICEMKVSVLENILHPVSFYKNKAKYLQQTSKILVERYNSDIPNNVKELVALPGVGPKMAHICMATAWNQITGIGVDVHVHRICNRLEWLPKATKEPEQTRVALEHWLPRHLWQKVNHLLVGFGQTICTPLKPKCMECLNCDICPAAPKAAKSQVKVENDEILSICKKSKFKKPKMHI